MEAKAERRGDALLAPVGAGSDPPAGCRGRRLRGVGVVARRPDRLEPAAARRVRRPPRRVQAGRDPRSGDESAAGRPDDRLRHRRRCDRSVLARRPADPRPAALEHDRHPLRLDAQGSDLGRGHELLRNRDGRGDCGRSRDARCQRRRVSRLRDHRLPRRCPARGARAALVAVAATGRPAVADRVHGHDGGAPLVPRRRGAVRGFRAAGSASRGFRRPGSRVARGGDELPDDDVHLGPFLGQRERSPRRCRTRHPGRDRNRVAQLRRGAGDRNVVRVRTAHARLVPDRRLHDPQRDRRARDRRTRGRRRREPVPSASRRVGPRSPAARRSSAPGRVASSRTTCWRCSSSAPPRAPRSRSSRRSSATSGGGAPPTSVRATRSAASSPGSRSCT